MPDAASVIAQGAGRGLATERGLHDRRARLGDHPVALSLATIAAALAPAYVIRWHVGFYPTTLLEAAILLSLAAFAVESVRARAVPNWRSPLTLPAVLLLVAGLLSIAVAPSRVAALGIYRAYFVEPVLYALVLATVVKRPWHACLVLAGFWVGATVLALADSAVVLSGLATHTFNPRTEPPAAIYESGNAVALFLVPLVGTAAAIAFYGTDRRARAAAVVFLLVGVPGSLLTFSRGGWAALLAVAVGLALSHRLRWPLLGGLAAFAALLGLLPTIRSRVAVQLSEGPGNTVGVRLELWRDTLAMLRGRPLFGAGLSGFQQRITPLYAKRHDPAPYPHNILLAFWSETGLLGLAAFVWIFCATAAAGVRGWLRGAPEWRALSLGILLALLAIAVHGMVDTPYFKNDLSLEFWGLAALATTAWRASAPGGA
ncbi:MAG TPA: O-antigen ligase family protein [Terriglobales bacterium]|nr:O-antigen ligase family protein [Terriglobales bacterium]